MVSLSPEFYSFRSGIGKSSSGACCWQPYMSDSPSRPCGNWRRIVTLIAWPRSGSLPITRSGKEILVEPVTRRTGPSSVVSAVRYYGPISNIGPAPGWFSLKSVWISGLPSITILRNCASLPGVVFFTITVSTFTISPVPDMGNDGL